MAGVGVEAGKSGRRTLDSEINMIPMIDLLMVTIAFLLITAVWSTMARLDASANVPGPPTAEPCDGVCEKPKELHVDMHASDKFVLTWKQDGVVLRSLDVPRGTTTAGGLSSQSSADSANRGIKAFTRARRKISIARNATSLTLGGLIAS